MITPTPQAVAELLARLELYELADRRAAAAYAEGYRAGAASQFEAGYAQAVADMKAAEHGHVASLAVYLRRWHLCCMSCRRNGHQDGCTRCEDRTRETFGRPHPDELKGRAA